jgi:hypothetical protein
MAAVMPHMMDAIALKLWKKSDGLMSGRTTKEEGVRQV